MPPRISLPSCFGTSTLCLRPAAKSSTSAASLPITFVANASSKAERRRHRDPYALAQARQRKAANVNRQEALRAERQAALGNPVRGITTPFVESFDTVASLPVLDVKPGQSNGGETVISGAAPNAPLNHFLKPSELERSLQHSYILTQPLISNIRDLQDPVREEEDIRRHADGHERASAAVARIVSLANGNQKDQTRANVQRCIDAFGRHNTDSSLQPRPPVSKPREGASIAAKTPRAGPDTGSSEVQIAILTAKIKVLADNLEAKGGQKDKINKRNLRVLVHRRQKLLAYLRRKERGSERWQNIVETLGLTEGTWKGEISL